MGKVDERKSATAKGGAFLMSRAFRWRFPARIFAAGGRRRACLILVLICCSPVLLPLVCLSIPLLCVASLCLRRRTPPDLGDTAEFLGRCQEGEEPPAAAVAAGRDAVVLEGRLLQRYLEDQLGLVGSALDCDDDRCEEC